MINLRRNLPGTLLALALPWLGSAAFAAGNSYCLGNFSKANWEILVLEDSIGQVEASWHRGEASKEPKVKRIIPVPAGKIPRDSTLRFASLLGEDAYHRVLLSFRDASGSDGGRVFEVVKGKHIRCLQGDEAYPQTIYLSPMLNTIFITADRWPAPEDSAAGTGTASATMEPKVTS